MTFATEVVEPILSKACEAAKAAGKEVGAVDKRMLFQEFIVSVLDRLM
jgi:hypothetical protein